MSYSVPNQIAEAKRWVGFHEGPGNQQPFTAWQFGGAMRNLPWCGSFADWCAVEKGGFRWVYAQLGWKGNAYVPAAVAASKRMATWRSGATRARPGWQSIFDWNHDGGSHIETVIQDDGAKFITIGGNTSDAVLYRTRDRKYLMGFCALDEAGQNAGPGPSPTPTPTPHPIPAPEEEDVNAGLQTITYRNSPFRRAFIALLCKDRKFLSYNGGKITWLGGTPTSGQNVGKAEPKSWTIPGNEPIIGCDEIAQTDDYVEFVVFGLAGGEYGGRLHK